MKSDSIVQGLQEAELALVAVGSGGRVESANPAAVRLFGPLEGVDLSVPPDSADPRSPLVHLAEVWSGLSDSSSPAGPALLRVKLGALSVFLWLNSVPLPRGEGRLFIAVDVTRFLGGSEAVTQVTAKLSHDLRSPLTSISGATELLLSGRIGPLQGAQEKMARIIFEGAGRMAAIIENVAAEAIADGGSKE